VWRDIHDILRHAERAPDYGRVDIRVDRTCTVGGRPLNVFFGVQNVTNRYQPARSLPICASHGETCDTPRHTARVVGTDCNAGRPRTRLKMFLA
jgi:hypothetical protein